MIISASCEKAANLLQFTLRFTRDVKLHFFHHPALYAALLDRLGNPNFFPKGVWLYCPERGRVNYKAGELYHFGVALTKDAELSAKKISELFRSRPQTVFGKTKGAPFGSNYQVESVWDLVAGAPLKGTAAWLNMESLDSVSKDLAGQKEVTLHWLSPLLIHRTPLNSRQFVMDGEIFDAGKLMDRVARSVRESWPEIAIPQAHDVKVAKNQMIRADVSYPKKRLLGATGRIRLEFANNVGPWALPLLLAGLVGAGKARNMGQGRFEVVGFPLYASWPPKPAKTILERAASATNLAAAREKMRDAGSFPGVDQVGLEEFQDALTLQLPRLASSLCKGKLSPKPLRGLIIRNKHEENGVEKLRPLAIPTMSDRFLQRAVLQELAPAAEMLFEDSSFAYRKGLSHKTAQKRVTEARRDGFIHVLDADIRAFFDRVDWNKLRDRIAGFWGDDPVVDALMDWVKAPVEFEGRLVERDQGLPQGAVISPLLANIYLDVLDEAIEQAGYRLVRFADDFVVMTKTKQRAVEAQEVVTEQLAMLGLTLNREKTRLTSFDQGFEFLGALFCRSVVLTVDKKSRGQTSAILDCLPNLKDLYQETGEPLDLSGWLTDFVAQKNTTPDEASDNVKADKPHWRPAVSPPSPERRPVYVVSRGVKLSGRKRGLYVEQDGAAPRLVGWREISEIVVLGGRHISSSVFQRAMANRIPIAFHKWDGTPAGLLLPDRVRSPSPLTMLQWRWRDDAGAALGVAKQLVEAKIRNTRVFVRRRGDGALRLREELKRLEDRAVNAQNSGSLRGFEGNAAHAYFSQWPHWLKAGFDDFGGRTARGAGDPVNAMLNLLYTQLFRTAHTSILSVGLDPYLGVLHEGRGRYAALAADLMEPFRFLVDRVVIELVNHGRITSNDFRKDEKGPYKIRILTEPLRLLIAQFEKQLARDVSDTTGRKDNFRGHLYRQTLSLARLVDKKEENFAAFRMKW